MLCARHFSCSCSPPISNKVISAISLFNRLTNLVGSLVRASVGLQSFLHQILKMPVRALSKELQKKAISELNEDPDRIQADLEHIRTWAEKQPHLKIRTDDQWLLSMLRGCKFSLERTKEKLDLMCTMKTVFPEFFSNRDPFLPEIQDLLNSGFCLPLPKTLDPAAPRIILIRIDPVDPDKLQVEDGVKLILMILDILLNEDDNFLIAGSHLFIDEKGITMNHVLLFTPTLIKKVHTCLMEAYAIRPQGFHAINVPPFSEMSFNVTKKLLNQKIVERIHIYGEKRMDEFYKAIPLSILPKEYGGDGDSLKNITAMWKKKVESYRNWFLDDVQYCSDESKRPGKPRTTEELCGIQGSFRKLDLD